MNSIKLKMKWQAGEASPGMWLRLADATILDMVADVGFDWVVIDAEHTAYDLQTLQVMFIALKGSSTLPLVRVPWNDFVYIKRLLDAGAAGVLVPHVKTTDDVKAAVAACKYPPVGIRGSGPRRPSRYGRLRQEYLATANDQTIVWIMIETIDAVNNLDDILAVEGLDGIIIGPGDLSMSMGLLGDSERPEVQAAINTVVAKARAARKPFGSGVPAIDDPSEWLNLGAQLVGVADDQMFIQRGAYAAMDRFHDLMAQKSQT